MRRDNRPRHTQPILDRQTEKSGDLHIINAFYPLSYAIDMTHAGHPCESAAKLGAYCDAKASVIGLTKALCTNPAHAMNASHRGHIGHRGSRILYLQTILTLAGWHSGAKPLKNHRRKFGDFSRKCLRSLGRGGLSRIRTYPRIKHDDWSCDRLDDLRAVAPSRWRPSLCADVDHHAEGPQLGLTAPR